MVRLPKQPADAPCCLQLSLQGQAACLVVLSSTWPCQVRCMHRGQLQHSETALHITPAVCRKAPLVNN